MMYISTKCEGVGGVGSRCGPAQGVVKSEDRMQTLNERNNHKQARCRPRLGVYRNRMKAVKCHAIIIRPFSSKENEDR